MVHEDCYYRPNPCDIEPSILTGKNGSNQLQQVEQVLSDLGNSIGGNICYCRWLMFPHQAKPQGDRDISIQCQKKVRIIGIEDYFPHEEIIE